MNWLFHPAVFIPVFIEYQTPMSNMDYVYHWDSKENIF